MARGSTEVLEVGEADCKLPPRCIAPVPPSSCAEGPTERRVLSGGCKQRANSGETPGMRLHGCRTKREAPRTATARRRAARSLEFPSVLNVPDVPAAAADHVAAGCNLATLDRPKEGPVKLSAVNV